MNVHLPVRALFAGPALALLFAASPARADNPAAGKKPPPAPAPVQPGAVPIAPRPAPPPPPPPDVQADRIAPEALAKRIVPLPAEQVTEETKKEVARLVVEYFKSLEAPAVPEEQKARIAQLTQALGADDWATREKASQELVKAGKPALAALREAVKSGDQEVASRAGEALKAVEAEAARPVLEALRKYPQTVWVVVQGQIETVRDDWTKAKTAAAAAEKAGRGEEAARLQTEVRSLGQRISDLDRLYWIVQNYTRYDR